MRNKILYTQVVLALSLWTATSHAEEMATTGETMNTAMLEDVTVTAARVKKNVDDIAGTVTVKNEDDIQGNIAKDEADLYLDAPGVQFGRDIRRFGATRLNIRGLEDNRVVQLVDGVKLPYVYDTSGPTNFTFSGPLAPSIGFLKRVEVVRGTASALYGSDALGGVAGYYTLDAQDIVEKDQTFGARYQFAYTGENDGRTHTALGAAQGEIANILLGLSHTDANQTSNFGRDGGSSVSRTKANPQQITDDGALLKFGLRPNAEHALNFMLEARNQEADIEVKRLNSNIPKVTSMSGVDETERQRISLEWVHTPTQSFYDMLTVRIFKQDAETDNDNTQLRTNTTAGCSAVSTGTNNCLVEQHYKINQDSKGLSLLAESNTNVLGKENQWVYGLDYSALDTKEIRDLTRTNLATGVTLSTLAGDTYPLRDFPKTETTTLGIYAQDEIKGVFHPSLTMTPGIRYDRIKLDPEVDSLFQTTLTNNGSTVKGKTESRFSPSLSANWQANDNLSWYGRVAGGFRAPNYDEIYGSFRNTTQQYAISPNADLKPETSVGLEIGSKWTANNLSAQWSIFDNHYKNFIERTTLNCPTDARCISGVATTFINENISDVRIYGTEARANWIFTPGWRLQGAIAYAHGENETDDQPLNSVEPTKLSLSLVRDAVTWGAEANVRVAKAVSRVDESDSEYFKPSGYSVVDLSAWWQPVKNTTLNVKLGNLFDKKYYVWSDIRQADSTNPTGVDFYSQPRRHLSASLTYQF